MGQNGRDDRRALATPGRAVAIAALLRMHPPAKVVEAIAIASRDGDVEKAMRALYARDEEAS